MEFINNTTHPALNFEGIDQLEQTFHVVVMRQTYTWNEHGLLILADEQDALCMQDELVDPKDIMSGVIEESDLCHYKPKCDIIVKGHAYTPLYRADKKDFKASIKVQTPDKVIFDEPIKASKYLFTEHSKKRNKQKDTFIKGRMLIDKTLVVHSPRYANAEGEGVTGNLRYHIVTQNMTEKVSLNPSSSFGGYCFIEEGSQAVNNIDEDDLIPKSERENIYLNPNHKPIAYFAQDAYNPSGSGCLSPLYHHAVYPKKIQLPQIHYAGHDISDSILNATSKKALKDSTHEKLVAGFGIMAKSHPNRHKYMGTVDQAFIDSDTLIPDGFDFAVWNCAYPDQQVENMVGNEWITLTNLCHPNTLASKQTEKGDIQLTLYLPEMLAYVLTNSNRSDMTESEVPMKLDTLIINPDEKKVNLVWRGIIASEYDPKTLFLEVADRAKQQKILQEYYTQKGTILRPYETKTINEVSP